MILHDFVCSRCHAEFEDLVRMDEAETACACGYTATRVMSAPKMFTEIIPTTLNSKRHKAGYQHSHADRPKTPGKIQVPVG